MAPFSRSKKEIFGNCGATLCSNIFLALTQQRVSRNICLLCVKALTLVSFTALEA
jgi:hypothetical protein